MKKALLASTISKSISKIKQLFPGEPSNSSVIFITTASKPEGDDLPWLEEDISAFKKMGFAVVRYDIDGKTEDQLRKDLGSFEIICIGGGNTYFLLDRVKKSGFDKIIPELFDKGVIYAGSSAGSVLAGATIDSARGADDHTIVPDLIDYSGLRLVNFAIIPHYDQTEYDEIFKKRIASWKEPYNVLLLNDNEAVIVSGETFRIVSCGTDRI